MKDHFLWSSIVFIASFAVYIQPITRSNAFISGSELIKNPIPALDEVYLTLENNDVKIDPETRSSLLQVFQNDYWGRPMDNYSSHKSYRPITVLSIRAGYFLADRVRMNGLFVQRVINILIHAILVQMVGRLYLSLFKSHASDVDTIIVMGMFMLHPTHIECVVNIANRGHLLSLMFTMISLDLALHPILAALIYFLGLISSETAVFLYPAVCLTWLSIDVCNRGENSKKEDGLLGHIQRRIFRFSLITGSTFAYLFLRHRLGWIHIPRDLIRQAENPFYALDGIDRMLNYSLVLSIHVVKSLGMGYIDMVGFSHEYGFDCVERIASLRDTRLSIPLLLIAVVFFLFYRICRKPGNMQNRKSAWCKERILIFLTFGAWMASLFPVSGFIRVGTFIADRIVMASTVASAILWTRILCAIFKLGRTEMIGTTSETRKKFALSLAFLLASWPLWVKLQMRSAQWMFPVSLLQSSLKSCPRSAKSNLEMSKVYISGLFGTPKDREKALFHAEAAQSIDPDFCDVNLQLAQLHIQKGKFLEFEEVITKGVICQYTMTDSVSLFQQYWSAVLKDESSVKQGANERYNAHMSIIEQAILEDKERTEKSTDGEIQIDSQGQNEL
mmetsp:Transcript_5993/g.9087  ORF Transcript_5993/g.9087 Transcript_5993/m.9087 type:complete len:616 (-) Transcript_5993:46-1893(-)